LRGNDYFRFVQTRSDSQPAKAQEQILVMKTINYGHNETFKTTPSRESVEKSGYESPAITPYTVDLATPAALAIVVSDLVSAMSAEARLRATFCASRAEDGASVSVPVVNSPEVSQVFGAGDFRLVTEDTLPYVEPKESEDSQDLPYVRIIGHNGFLGTLTFEDRMGTRVKQERQELAELSRVVVPESRYVMFATTIADPTKGQRRQAYIAMEVIAEVMRYDDRRTALAGVMANHRGARRRCDHARVLAAALDVVCQLPEATVLENEYLVEVIMGLSPTEKALQPTKDYPRVLVRLPSGELVFVETHPARKAGGEADAWMNGRLAGHFRLGEHLANFAGVIIFTARSMKPVHVTGIGSRHLVGSCATCGQVK
jgi:hypothetical protein